jgi:hypothetical protein
MEFHVQLPPTPNSPDLVELNESLRRQDPAALVDVDASGSTLRISSAMAAPDLAEALREAGLPVAANDVVQQPSVCCGGCSG